MRDLIRHILKEETEDVNMINKGINIAVKILKQEYPFVKGWRFEDPIDTYKTVLYINLIINYDEVLEFYGLKPSKSFMRNYMPDEKVPYQFSGMIYEGIINDPYEEYRKLVESLKDVYEYLPSDVKMEADFPTSKSVDYKELKVDGFIFEK
jgi:hypothetical protein